MEPQGTVLLYLISFSSFRHINAKMLMFFSKSSMIHTSCLFRGWLWFLNSATCSLLQLCTKQIHIFNQVDSKISCQQPLHTAYRHTIEENKFRQSNVQALLPMPFTCACILSRHFKECRKRTNLFIQYGQTCANFLHISFLINISCSTTHLSIFLMRWGCNRDNLRWVLRALHC